MRKSFGVVVLVTAALVPGVAQGSEVSLSDPTTYDIAPNDRASVFYDADPGETNNLTVSLNGSQVIFNDPGATITTSTPSRCTISNANHTATCTPTGASPKVPFVNVFLGDQNDTLVNNAPIPPSVFNDTPFPEFFATGGSGNDSMTGSSTPDFFFPGTGSDTARGLGGNDLIFDENEFDYDPQPTGGVGDDHLFGGDGDDNLFGGGGNDEVRGEAGNDTLDSWTGNNTTDGGPGIDSVQFFLPKLDQSGNLISPLATDQGALVVLNAAAPTTGNGVPGQNDTLIGIEDVFGTEGADKITGSTFGNILAGSSGNDTIVGGAGVDNIMGQGDTDSLDSVDNETDRVDCGGQLGDTAKVENIDQVLNCITPANVATVTAAGPPGPVIIRDLGDKAKPTIRSLTMDRTPSARALRRNGRFTFRITSGDPVTQSNVVIGTLTGQVRNATISTAGELQFAQRRRTIKGSSRTTVVLTVPKKLRRALKKGKKLRLLIQLSDAAGNTTTRRVNLKLAR